MTLAVPGPTLNPGLPDVALRQRSPRPANATLVERQELGAGMARFRFRPDDGRTSLFVAGQYVPIALTDPSVPPRPYSIASGPGAQELDFVISLVEDGSLTPRLFGLPPGARVHMGKARGLFRLEHADERDHLLIGTGSGIAPLLSMIASLGSRPAPPRTIVLHGVRVRAELAGLDGVADGNGAWLSYRPTLSRALDTDAWMGRRGRVGEHLDALIAGRELAKDRTAVYLCGNPAMIDGCRTRLAAYGMSPDAIRSEGFLADQVRTERGGRAAPGRSGPQPSDS